VRPCVRPNRICRRCIGHSSVLKVPEKQVRELGSRIKERLGRNGVSARQISESSLPHLHSPWQFPMLPNGTTWSNNVLRVALTNTNVPVAFPNAMSSTRDVNSIREIGRASCREG